MVTTSCFLFVCFDGGFWGVFVLFCFLFLFFNKDVLSSSQFIDMCTQDSVLAS